MGLAHSPRIVTNGLVLCLDAANTKSYPGSGTTANDLSGSGSISTLTNGPTYSASNGGYFSFDGIDDYALLNNNTIADNLSAMTVSVWAYRNWSVGGSSYMPILTKISDAANGAGWDFGTGWGGTDIYFYTQNNGGSLWNARTTTVSGGSYWMNIVASYSVAYSVDGKLYINGINRNVTIQNSSNPASITTTSAVTLGSRNGSNSYGTKYFTGNIAQASIYNRALTDAEILQNFNALRGRFGL